MSEEQVVDQVPQVEGQQEEQKSELSSMEQRAIEMGWRPKEEFDGDEDDFIDAKEFVRRKPLFDKIDHQNKELKEVKKALKVLNEHHQKVKESEFKAALNYLKEQKKLALSEGDADKLIEIDEQIVEAKAKQTQEAQAEKQQSNQPHPEFIQWVQANDWYAKDAEMRMTADQIGTAYAASNPDKDPREVLDYVKTRIRKLYSEKFTNPNRDKPSAVEGSSRQPVGKPASKEYPLSEEEKKVMHTFVRQGIMTKEQYIDQLKQIKGEA